MFTGLKISNRVLSWGCIGLGSLLALQRLQAAHNPTANDQNGGNPPVAVTLPALGKHTGVPALSTQRAPGRAPNAFNSTRSTDRSLQAATQLAQLSTQWLNQLGQAEIALTDSRPGSLLRGSHCALLLPWYQRHQQLLFTQWQILREDGNNTLTIGMGQRYFATASGYWGYNLFYDYRFKGHHQRLGIGLERRCNTLAVTVNGYLPLSAERLVDNNAHKVRPAHGVDIRLQQSPQSQPHWRFNLIGEHYFGNQVVALDQRPKRHPLAVTLGFDYTPLPLVTARYGFKLASGGQRRHQLQLTLNYSLGVPLAQQRDPQQVAASRSLAGNRLALVQRHSQVVLQQRPNEVIQLQLPSGQHGKPGDHLTFDITLSTSRPRSEWELNWKGNLLAQATKPQINSAKDSATLTLPQLPGTYQLQLMARNTHSGLVATSNVMSVQVVAVPAPPIVTAAANPPELPVPKREENSIHPRSGSGTAAAAAKPTEVAMPKPDGNSVDPRSESFTTATGSTLDNQLDPELASEQGSTERRDNGQRISEPVQLASAITHIDIPARDSVSTVSAASDLSDASEITDIHNVRSNSCLSLSTVSTTTANNNNFCPVPAPKEESASLSGTHPEQALNTVPFKTALTFSSAGKASQRATAMSNASSIHDADNNVSRSPDPADESTWSPGTTPEKVLKALPLKSALTFPTAGKLSQQSTATSEVSEAHDTDNSLSLLEPNATNDAGRKRTLSLPLPPAAKPLPTQTLKTSASTLTNIPGNARASINPGSRSSDSSVFHCLVTPALKKQVKDMHQKAGYLEASNPLSVGEKTDNRDLSESPRVGGDSQKPMYKVILETINKMNTLSKKQSPSQEDLHEAARIAEIPEKTVQQKK